MKCKKCGFVSNVENGEARFCPNCGSPLQKPADSANAGVDAVNQAGKVSYQQQNTSPAGSGGFNLRGLFTRCTRTGPAARLLLIGSILCFLALTFGWATETSVSNSINWIRKGTITNYVDQYGQVIDKHDGSYLSPEASSSRSSTDLTGADMTGGGLSLLVALTIFLSHFFKLNLSLPGWSKYIPFASLVLFTFVLLEGLVRGGLSIGLILFAGGLFLLYRGFRIQSVWFPVFMRNWKV